MLKLEARPQASKFWSYGSPLLALLITVIIGVILFVALGKDPVKGLQVFFWEPIRSPYALGELMVKATPLLLIALGLAVCFRTNVWNIGAEGQYVIGAVAAGGVALLADKSTGSWIVIAIMGAGVLGGMAWAAIPAWLKSRFNTNEILTSLMLTYVATQLLIWLVSGPWRDPQGMNFPLSEMFSGDALYPTFGGDWRIHWLRGTRLNASIFLTLAAIPLVWLFMRRSFAGFRLSVGGLAPLAARYAGFSEKRTIWTSLLLSGGLAGLAGMGEIAGPIGQLQASWSPGYGFTAIIVAFVGRLHPFGVVLASLLMALLYLGGENVQTSLQLPQALSGVFQGLLLFCLLGADLFVNYRVRRRQPVAAGH